MKYYKANPELHDIERPIMIEDPDGGWCQRKDAEANLGHERRRKEWWIEHEAAICCDFEMGQYLGWYRASGVLARTPITNGDIDAAIDEARKGNK